MPEIRERKISGNAVLVLLGSLTLCDHIGDLADDVFEFAQMLGIDTSQTSDLSELGEAIRKLQADPEANLFTLDEGDIYVE
jgi:NTP pyrophosphatase (non-canonical NTP hydrolase)